MADGHRTHSILLWSSPKPPEEASSRLISLSWPRRIAIASRKPLVNRRFGLSQRPMRPRQIWPNQQADPCPPDPSV
jgi:hypothetical protein